MTKISWESWEYASRNHHHRGKKTPHLSDEWQESSKKKKRIKREFWFGESSKHVMTCVLLIISI